MTRKNIPGGAVWEPLAGYSRAVRIGNHVAVSGTAAVDGDRQMGDSVYEQMQFVLLKIEKALNAAGADKKDVIRTRIFLTDMRRWEEAARAHGEFFSGINPACTMVEVSRLIREDLLVEAEADAIIE